MWQMQPFHSYWLAKLNTRDFQLNSRPLVSTMWTYHHPSRVIVLDVRYHLLLPRRFLLIRRSAGVHVTRWMASVQHNKMKTTILFFTRVTNNLRVAITIALKRYGSKLLLSVAIGWLQRSAVNGWEMPAVTGRHETGKQSTALMLDSVWLHRSAWQTEMGEDVHA